MAYGLGLYDNDDVIDDVALLLLCSNDPHIRHKIYG